MAATWAQLFDFQNAVETASHQLLVANGYTNIYTSRGTSLMDSPRYEVVFVLGAPTGKMEITPDGLPIQSAFAGNVTFTIVTPRKTDATTHQTMQNLIFNLFKQANIYNSGSLMPYHTMQDMVLSGVSPTVDTEDGEDISAITYNLKIAMKSTEMPNA